MTRCFLLCTAAVLLVAVPARSQDETPPLSDWVSGYVAGYGYNNHSYRSGGGEAQVRVDLWQGLSWSVHFAYTADVIAETGSDGTLGADVYHDLMVGGRWAPWSEKPLWFWGEGHGLIGATTYGTGGGFLAGVGGLWRGTTLELGAGGLWVQGDRSVNATVRLSHQFLRWLQLSLLGTFTRNGPDDSSNGPGGNHFAYGAGAELGPFSNVKITLRWLGGERVMALDQMGTIPENLPDIMRDTFLVAVSFPLSPRVGMTLGASIRRADEPSGQTYWLTSGYAGVGIQY